MDCQDSKTADHRQHLLTQKQLQVEALLAGFERVLVAFSGGVDSTLLTVLAHRVLGKPNVLAVTANSPSLAREDLEETNDLAQRLDLEHLVIATDEVSQPSYQANTEARCYFCKRTLFVELEALARQRAISVILYGAIGDDRLSERPGQRAAMEFRVRAPLQEVGMEKWEVRELARRLGVPNWDRPQNACLSSRIPHGHMVTVETLYQIEQAEAFLSTLGFHQVRVRHLGAHARIEVDQAQVNRFVDEEDIRRDVVGRLLQLGFSSVGVDRSGYRSGGANRSPVDEMLLSGKCGGVAQLVRAGES